MNYFITGGTGFIGKFLVARLVQRPEAKIYLLVRESSRERFLALQHSLGEHAHRLEMVVGDITDPKLVSISDAKRLKGHIDHVFHLAAVYDMDTDDATANLFNVEGTRHVVRFANALGANVCLHHTSSIAVAGSEYNGTFTEAMFDEGQPLTHPYHRTKYESEKVVREEANVRYRIYRPGAVVGSSVSGEIDKIDGPYYLFKSLQKLSQQLPSWLPLVGIDGGIIPIVPVDYVAQAMDALAHKPNLDGQVFCLLQERSITLGELMDVFLRVAHGPRFAKRLNTRGINGLVRKLSAQFDQAASARLKQQLAKLIGAPFSTLPYSFMNVHFDTAGTQAALLGTGISCPDIRQYAPIIWQYWEQYLDTDQALPAAWQRQLQGKVVLITGASSGIGFATAKKLAGTGARVILVARGREKLEQARELFVAAGGDASCYPCDMTQLDDIDRMAATVLREFGHVDVLINNAGRSIRRAVIDSTQRFHDFERTMQLNYFGSIRLIMALLPSMVAKHSGHIINISSIGVQANGPRYAAYVASKAALDAFTRCLSAEVLQDHIQTTTIYMPLVRTPMIAPTKAYRNAPAWSPEQAANTVIKAILKRPSRVATPIGTVAEWGYVLWPKANEWMRAKGFQLFAVPKTPVAPNVVSVP